MRRSSCPTTQTGVNTHWVNTDKVIERGAPAIVNGRVAAVGKNHYYEFLKARGRAPYRFARPPWIGWFPCRPGSVVGVWGYCARGWCRHPEYQLVPTGPRLSLASAIPMPGPLARRHIEIGIAYLAGYVLLDWLSDVHPIANVNITPWNPPTGLTFAFILLFGTAFLPWIAVAPVLADAVVRGLTLPFGAELAQAVIIGGGYAAA